MHRRFLLFLALIMAISLLPGSVRRVQAGIPGAGRLPNPEPPPQIPIYDPEWEVYNTPEYSQPEPDVNHAPMDLSALSQKYNCLVWQSYRDRNWEIYSWNGSGFPVRITNSSYSEIEPRSNRGCSRIVFANNSSKALDIFVMNADGTGQTRLTYADKNDAYPSWSLDGKKIVFQSERDGQSEIYVMNIDGSNQTRLTTDENYDGMPAWSPDGSKIAFISNRSGGYRIYTMNADGSGVTRINDQIYSAHPRWSPDGNKISFDADWDGDGMQEIAVVGADGSNAHVADDYNTDMYSEINGDWDPAGSKIYFELIKYATRRGVLYWTKAEVYSVPPGGGNRRLELWNQELEWNPDVEPSDDTAPVTSIAPLKDISPGKIYLKINWADPDEYQYGPDLYYDVQVKDGNGNWQNWQVQAKYFEPYYYGKPSHTYYFRVKASDSVFNMEPWPGDYDAATTVETVAPETHILAMPKFSRPGTLDVQWADSDPYDTEITNYVQVRDHRDGVWQELFTGPLANNKYFTGLAGHTYSFRVRGVDTAGNQEPWPAGDGDTTTSLCYTGNSGQIIDNAGAPVSAAQILFQADQLVLDQFAVNHYRLCAIQDLASIPFSVSKEKYGSLPAESLRGERNLDYALPPLNDMVLNGNFESNSGWQTSGKVELSYKYMPHGGNNAALLGDFYYAVEPGLPSAINQTLTIPAEMKSPTLSFFYLVQGYSGAGGAISAAVTQGITTTILLNQFDMANSNWQHFSYDMSAWSGKTITLTFSASHTSGLVNFGMAVDDVTLGSAYPDIWVDIDGNDYAKPGEVLTYTLRYGNQGGGLASGAMLTYTLPAGVSLVSASIPPVISGQQLIWDLGDLSGKSQPAEIQVAVAISPEVQRGINLSTQALMSTTNTEGEMLNNTAYGDFFTGWRIYLPVVTRP